MIYTKEAYVARIEDNKSLKTIRSWLRESLKTEYEDHQKLKVNRVWRLQAGVG